MRDSRSTPTEPQSPEKVSDLEAKQLQNTGK